MSHLVRSGALSGLPELIDEFGVELPTLLGTIDLPPDLFDDEDTLVEIVAMGELLERAATLCNCPHFGLLLGSRQPMSFLGVVGLIMQSAPDMVTAFKECIQYQNLRAQGVNWSLALEGNYIITKLTHASDIQPVSQQSIELSLAQSNNVSRLMTNNKWRPLEVCFHYAQPSETWFYRQLFGCKVTFNAEFDGIISSSEYLRLPMLTKNDYLHDTLNRYVAEMGSDASEDMIAQLKRVVRQLLPTGRCSIENAAAFFNCDKRTLQRRLKRKGLVYKTLLDGERFSLACRHLEDSSIPLTTVAEVVGFADISTFSRAFKQQFGLSPSQWRRNKQPK